jgi:hypothetical protein
MQYLHRQLGLGLWMFTRVDGNAWTILDIFGSEYNAAPVRSFPFVTVSAREWSPATDRCSRRERWTFRPTPRHRLVDVWKAADDAMYVVKRARREEALALVS